MKILFYDGILNDFLQANEGLVRKMAPRDRLVEAANGPSANIATLKHLVQQYELNPKVCVITNSLVALSHVYGWNKEEGHTDIYLWREKYKDFIRCDKLTLKEIREAHNIEKMYMSGSFEEEIPELPEHLKGI